MAEIFKACGDIVLVRILRPGNPIPADVRPFVNKHPEMAAKVCALVEFERTEFAMKAVREKNCEEEEKMKVLCLFPEIRIPDLLLVYFFHMHRIVASTTLILTDETTIFFSF